MKELANKLNDRFKSGAPEEVLAWFMKEYKGEIGLASSLSIEDQSITKMMCDIEKQPNIFTLDTGRVFPETYSLMERTNMTYGIKIKIFFPEAKEVEEMTNKDGVNLFYNSIELRRKCCHIRKIGPLNRAFSDLKVWICGLRHEQSVTRSDVQMVEWDEGNSLLKLNPLINWTEEQTWDYIKTNGIPYNRLHDQGFPSIGCQPCTRAIKEGEDVRAGRWWWENPEQKECGLHK